jgi:hypothetical protein
MNRHPYLCAYMAGVLLPTWFLLFVMSMYLLGHITGHIPAGLERAIIFPMAVVPNVWGLWNLLYVSGRFRKHVPIGIFGAILPVLLIPGGVALALALNLHFYTAGRAAVALPLVVAIYYLAWKYGVGPLNRIVGIASPAGNAQSLTT